MAQTKFSKWHGLGNDYIIVGVSDFGMDMTPARASAICDRHFGIGSDGILLWSGTEGAGFQLKIFNPDGSLAEMCGNGIRMLARYLQDMGYATDPVQSITTDAGVIAPTLLADGRVEVFMGQARLGGAGIVGYAGTRDESEALGARLEIDGEELEFTFVDMGNPHCVIAVGDLDDCRVSELGPAIERHVLFPNRVNVEFMKITGPKQVAMRVWERGVGETNACGTGACAVAVAANRLRGVASPMTVSLPGGDLIIDVGPQMEVWMTGPAQEIYSGIMAQDFMARLQQL
ncbi:MAG: diaminopimelate epimerase [Thermoleophilia bacterium]